MANIRRDPLSPSERPEVNKAMYAREGPSPPPIEKG